MLTVPGVFCHKLLLLLDVCKKLVLLVNKTWEFSKKSIVKPTDLANLKNHEKSDAKAKLIILDGVKDHLIPHLSRKTTTYEM